MKKIILSLMVLTTMLFSKANTNDECLKFLSNSIKYEKVAMDSLENPNEERIQVSIAYSNLSLISLERYRMCIIFKK